jgi:2'-hydroxyisoflavone reductase
VKRYVYISSISAYASTREEGQDETARLATLADPTVETMGKSFENYGGLKALCEQAAAAALPGRAAIVRPGYIVGPDDPTGRFTYWPVRFDRFDRGGDVAVPGAAGDPIQIIDVRDLGEWLVLLCERGDTGAFNACGPAERLTMGALVASCQKATPARATPVWLPVEFLARHGNPEELFPIWAPYQGDTRGFHTWSFARAQAAGLRFRPVDETVRDTLAWYKTQLGAERGRTRLAGPTAEEEAKLLAAFRAA